MFLIDTHAHLDEPAFDLDRGEVIERAVAQGVVRIVTIGTTAASSRLAAELAARFSAVHAAVGIQPNYAVQASAADWETILELSRLPKVVAIGETGLDKYWNETPLDVQSDFFDRHLELARRLNKPLVVHCRDAEAEVVAHLSRAAAGGSLRGVMHSFTGTVETARRCVELGLHLSFAGMVTYKKSQALRDLVREVPLDRILVETDAPYLPPQPMRGKRNEPAFVRMTANALADVLELPHERFAAITTENACRLFHLTCDVPPEMPCAGTG